MRLREAPISQTLFGSFSICFELIEQLGSQAIAEVLPRVSGVRRRSYLNMIVWSRMFDLRPVSRDILIETAKYREHAGMPKLPDAIHVVTAIRSGCRTVLSADSRLKLPNGYSVLSPVAENLSRLIQELS